MDSTAGEYGQPISRTGFVQCPIYSTGTTTVTARLRAQNMEITGVGSLTNHLTRIWVQNTGNSAISIKFAETSDRSVAGVRSTVGTATLAAGGNSVISFNAAQKFLELSGTSGESTLRFQVESRLRYDLLGFDRADPFYPTVLWKPFNDSTWANL